MEVMACPACGSTDIRLVRELRCTEAHPVVEWRSGKERPVFTVAGEPLTRECEVVAERVECVDGHAHRQRIGFDVEWADPAPAT